MEHKQLMRNTSVQQHDGINTISLSETEDDVITKQNNDSMVNIHKYYQPEIKEIITTHRKGGQSPSFKASRDMS